MIDLVSVWKVAPVEEQPSIILDSWDIMELPNGDRHFVGYCFDNWEGRVSSKIVEFDPEALKGKTSSGRIYQLVKHRQGANSDAWYVWSIWRRRNNVQSYKQITGLFVEDCPDEFKVIQHGAK